MVVKCWYRSGKIRVRIIDGNYTEFYENGCVSSKDTRYCFGLVRITREYGIDGHLIDIRLR
jgi:hypothetical protein